MPGGVFGDGVVFAGILVALAGPFWPGGAAPRGVAIFVPGFVSAPCEPIGKGHCHLQPMPAPLNHSGLKEAKIGETLCLLDATNASHNCKGLLGTQTHSPAQMPSALNAVSLLEGTVPTGYQPQLC